MVVVLDTAYTKPMSRFLVRWLGSSSLSEEKSKSCMMPAGSRTGSDVDDQQAP